MSTKKAKNNRGKPKIKKTKNRIPVEFTQKMSKRVVLYNPLPSMPDEFDSVIRTFGTIAPTATTASISSVVFTNSLLQTSSDFTSSGSSSTLNNIGRNYSKYRVMGYKIKYTLVSRSTGDSHLTVLHTPIAQTFSAGVNWQPDSATRDKATYHVIVANTKSPCVTGGGQKYDLMSVVGQSEFMEDASYAGTLNSSGVPTSPTDLTYLYFYTGPVAGGNFTASTSPLILLMLTQYVKFYDKQV